MHFQSAVRQVQLGTPVKPRGDAKEVIAHASRIFSYEGASGGEDDDDDNEDDDNNGDPVPESYNQHGVPPFDGNYVNKQRVLVFCSRGVTARARHLLEDVRRLLPHHKKEVKLDTKDDPRTVNEIAEIVVQLRSFFEARKRSDLYMDFQDAARALRQVFGL